MVIMNGRFCVVCVCLCTVCVLRCEYYYLFVRVCVFFIFKQKTAYEMRISDWSSDVCSSDLQTYRRARSISDRLIRTTRIAMCLFNGVRTRMFRTTALQKRKPATDRKSTRLNSSH